jgi:F-type H+-transporting ATPase subunit a
MFFIELISHIARPISLGIRLMANMTADHMVLTIFLGLLPASLFFVPIPLPMYLLGTIVVIVQALVFCLLSTVYIAMAIEHAEH